MKSLRVVALAGCFTVSMGGSLEADVFTVGTGGTHGTVQAAIDAAIALGGQNEVRIARGTFTENVQVNLQAGELDITGDWNASFTTKGDDPSRTVIDGGGLGSSVTFTVSNSRLLLECLTLTNSAGRRGGLFALTSTDGELEIRKVRAIGNRADNSGSVSAGGMTFYADGGSRISLFESEIRDNEAVGFNNASAGGLELGVGASGQITARYNVIADNHQESSNPGEAGGVYIQTEDDGIVNFSDNTVQANHAMTDNFSAIAGGAFANFGSGGATGRIVARRNRFLDNTSNAQFISHVSLASVGPTTRIEFTDSLVASSGHRGIEILTFDGSVVRMTNLTVTGHQQEGIFSLLGQGSTSGVVSLYNTIAHGNATDVALANPSLHDIGGNLIGIDPLFVNPAANNYSVPPDSPAVDMGLGSPPGGLGPFDLDGGPRVEGGTVDIGAYEFGLEPCVVTPQNLCLIGDRFRVEVGWRPGGGTTGPATADGLTDDAGYFFFNNPNNIEVVIKMSNACSFNNRFWVFAAGLTNVEVQLTVTDTETGEIRTYRNDLGTPFAPIQDTAAFATCP